MGVQFAIKSKKKPNVLFLNKMEVQHFYSWGSEVLYQLKFDFRRSGAQTRLLQIGYNG